MPAQPPLAVHRFSARSSNLSATDDRSVMRSANNESLHALCREETTRFSQAHAPEWNGDLERHVVTVAAHVEHNLANGRPQRWLNLPKSVWPMRPALLAYIDKVLWYYQQTRKLLMRLEGRDDQAWGELYADLHRAAQRALTA